MERILVTRQAGASSFDLEIPIHAFKRLPIYRKHDPKPVDVTKVHCPGETRAARRREDRHGR